MGLEYVSETWSGEEERGRTGLINAKRGKLEVDLFGGDEWWDGHGE